MRNRRYFHIHSDGFCEKISREKYFKILIKQRNWKSKKLIASVYDNEISFYKGTDHIFLKREWLKKILEAPKK